MMKLLVLYEELAPYFLNNIKTFAEHYQVPVLIVAKHVNPIAPFQFQIHSNYIHILYREDFSFNELMHQIKSFRPTVLLQAGWIYKPYFDITRQLKLSRNILLLDNQWQGTIKQRLGSFYFQYTYKKLFHKAFVPAQKQKSFALHLGFAHQDIETGFYCCDTPFFENIYHQRQHLKKRHYKFLYIGRYAPEKNIQLLWDAFIELCREHPHSWKLVCAGNGPISPLSHPQIEHKGFVQPTQLAKLLAQADVFVLPSKFEPWGVVIHEVATAGLPIISSSKVGANEYFVQHTQNGFIFTYNNKNELKHYLYQMIQMNDEHYFAMCQKSYELSQYLNTEKWIKKIHHLCQI